MTSMPWSSSTTRTLCRMTPSLLISTMPLCTCTSVPMSRRRKSMAPRSRRPRISGFCSVPRSRARTCALPCASVTASGATNASRRALTSPSTSAWMFSGANPGPSVARPPRLHRRPVDGDGQVLHRDAALIERELARADDHVAIEVLGAQADGVGDRPSRRAGRACPACRAPAARTFRPPCSRSTGLAAPRNGCSSSRSRCPDRLPEIALPSSRPATTRSPPSVLKCASSSTTRSPLTLTCSGRAASTRTRWTVVSPFAPSTARATDSHSSGSRTSSASGRAGSMSTRDAAADDAARVAERRPARARAPRSRRGGSRPRRERAGPWAPAPPARRRRSDRTAGRGRRRRATPVGPTGVGRQREVPGAELHAAHHRPRARSTSPASSGRSGRPPTCSFALAKPLTGTSDFATPGRPASGSLSSTTSRSRSWCASADLAADVDGAARLAFEVQRLHRRRLSASCRSCPCSAAPRPARASRRRPARSPGVPAGTRDARGDSASSGPCASACSDSRPRDVGAPRQRRQIDVAQVQLQVDDRRAQRLARALLPQLHGAAAVDAAAEHRPRPACRGAACRARGRTCATSSGSLRPPALMPCDAGVAGHARILEAAVGLGVDARALGERRQAHLVEQPAEIGGDHAQPDVDQLALEVHRPLARSRVAPVTETVSPSVLTRSAAQRRVAADAHLARQPVRARPRELQVDAAAGAPTCAARSARASMRPCSLPPAIARSSGGT